MRRLALVTAFAVCAALAVVLPAHASSTLRDALVYDVLEESGAPQLVVHKVYDSTGGAAPVAGPSPVPGGLRVAQPAGAPFGGDVEILPADGSPLAVGHYARVRGNWVSGPRPYPVLQELNSDSSCSGFELDDFGLTDSLDVREAEYDGTGTLTRFAADYRMACSNHADVVEGSVRYHSDFPYAAMSSYLTYMPFVIAGSRSPLTVTLTNDGSTPVTLGAPVSVPSSQDSSTLEVNAGGETCSSAPVQPGGTCTLHLDYVDDGVHNADVGAQVHLSASELPRGYVAVIVHASGVVYPPANLLGDEAFDGVRLRWDLAPGGQWKVRRVDGPTPVLLATLPSDVHSYVDSTLAKGESATYQVSASTSAGEAAAAPLTLTRPQLPDPPSAGSRNVLVVEDDRTSTIVDSASGGTVKVESTAPNRILVTAGRLLMSFPRLAGPGVYPVGGTNGVSVGVTSPTSDCSRVTGTLDVREAWIRADMTVHRLDLDAHLTCAGLPVEAQLRLGTSTPAQAVATTELDGSLYDFRGTVGQPSTHRRLRVQNSGDESIGVGALTIGGGDASAFSATSACPTTLPAGATCDIDVAFTPARAYASYARLTLALGTAVGSRSIPLSGQAIGPPPARLPNATAVLGRVLVPLTPYPDGGSPVTAFHVQRADPTGGFVTVQDLPGTAASWTDGPLTPGATYRYRVVAENQYGSVTPGEAQTATVTIPREELLASIGRQPTDPSDLESVSVSNGVPVPLGTGQDTDYPAVSPDGHWLAYSVYDANGNADLWLRSTDGSSPPRALVSTAGTDETEAAWSPDSRTLVFTGYGPSSTQLDTLDPFSGLSPQPLSGGASAAEASWLADGSGVVATDLGATKTRLVTIASDGARTVLASTDGGSGPAVSPRGDRIAYVSTDTNGIDHLWLVPVRGGSSTSVATEVYNVLDRPVWAPDGSAIVVNQFGPSGSARVLVWRDGVSGAPATWSTEQLAVGYQVFGLTWRRQDREAPAITFPAAASVTGARFTVPVQVVDDTVPVGGLSVTCSVDGASVGQCTNGYRGALGDGPHTLTVSASDPFGHTSQASFTWTVRQLPPVITFPNAASRSTGAVHVPVQVTADTPDVGVACLLDGTPAGDCRAGLDASLSDGPHALMVTATDPQGAEASATFTWVVDTQAPQVSVVPLPAVVRTSSFTFRYAATDPSGVGTFDVRYRYAVRGGPFSPYLLPSDGTGTSASSRTASIAPGYEYCMSVRARDRLGTVSRWTTDTCTASPIDDRTLRRLTTGWTSVTSSPAYHRTLSRAVHNAAVLSVTTGSGVTRRVILVATTCPTCGTVDLLVGGVRIRTLSLRTATTRPGSLLSVTLPHPVRGATLGIRTIGAAQVLIDGLVLRSI